MGYPQIIHSSRTLVGVAIWKPSMLGLPPWLQMMIHHSMFGGPPPSTLPPAGRVAKGMAMIFRRSNRGYSQEVRYLYIFVYIFVQTNPFPRPQNEEIPQWFPVGFWSSFYWRGLADMCLCWYVVDVLDWNLRMEPPWKIHIQLLRKPLWKTSMVHGSPEIAISTSTSW